MDFVHRCRSLVLALAGTVVLATSGTSHAQLPRPYLTSVFPPGGQAGTTVEVTITGANLEDATALLFQHPGFTVERVTEQKDGKEVPVPNRFRVKIAPDVPVGYYDVRVLGRFGVSNPRTFVVSDFTEITEREPNNSRDQAQPLLNDGVTRQVVNGQVNGATDLDYFALSLKKGQRVLIEVEAQRIDSRLNPVLTLYDDTGRELDFNDNHFDLDSLLDFTAPRDGTYYVLLADQVYDGSVEYFYRLRVGTFPVLEHVLPIAAPKAKPSRITLFGRLLAGGQPVEAFVRGQRLEARAVELTAPQAGPIRRHMPPWTVLFDGFAYLFTSDQGTSNAVLIAYAEHPIVLAQEPNDQPDKAQPITPPVEVHGTFEATNDRDWFVFEAKRGQVWWIELQSQTLDLPTDPVLVIRRARDGAQLARVDDDRTSPANLVFSTVRRDAVYRFAVPEDGKFLIQARDLYASVRGDARLGYRLIVRPESPSFTVFALVGGPLPNVVRQPSGVVLRSHGTAHLDLYLIRRDGFSGEVRVRVSGLPEGVEAPEVVFGPGQVYAPLVLAAAEPKPVHGPLTLTARAEIAGKPVERPVKFGGIVWAYNPGTRNPASARLRRWEAFSTIAESAPYRLVAEPRRLELARGLVASIKVKVERRGDFKDAVSGITAMVLPPNVSNANITIPANQTEGTLNFQTRANTPLGHYSIAVRGTARVPYTKDPSGKNKRPINVYLPSNNVELIIVDPVALSFEPTPLVVKKGQEGELTIRVKRQGGFAGPVPVQFRNVPNGVRIGNTTIAADADEIKLKVTVAESAPTGERPVTVVCPVRVGNQTVTPSFQVNIRIEQ